MKGRSLGVSDPRPQTPDPLFGSSCWVIHQSGRGSSCCFSVSVTYDDATLDCIFVTICDNVHLMVIYGHRIIQGQKHRISILRISGGAVQGAAIQQRGSFEVKARETRSA